MAIADRFSQGSSPHHAHHAHPSEHSPHRMTGRRVHHSTHVFEGTAGGSGRWVPRHDPRPEDAPAPAPATPQATAEDHVARVVREFPEVGQVGSQAHHRFHRAFRKAGSNPEHALHVARAVLR